MKKKKSTQKQYTHLTDKCIFCESTSTSKEHLFPVWFKSFLRETQNNHFFSEFRNDDLKTEHRQLFGESSKRTGPLGSKKIKIVCENCNNGWMSQIESNAMSVFPALVNDEKIILRKQEQKAVYEWMILKTIIYEHQKKDFIVIKKPDRVEFYKKRTVPTNWQVWFARLDKPYGRNVFGQERGGFEYIEHPIPQIKMMVRKMSIMIVGKLLIYAAMFPVTETGLPKYKLFDELNDKVVRLYPNEYKEIEWDKTVCLNETEVLDLGRNMFDFLKMIQYIISSKT